MFVIFTMKWPEANNRSIENEILYDLCEKMFSFPFLFFSKRIKSFFSYMTFIVRRTNHFLSLSKFGTLKVKSEEWEKIQQTKWTST